jgi:ABC-2 type transport system ATP-binding protein
MFHSTKAPIELIKTIGKEKTVMLSTHIMQEVEEICDRVIFINKGEIVADDTAAHLQFGSSVQTVYVEMEGTVSRAMLMKIEGVSKVKDLKEGWLVESTGQEDLRKLVSKFAQENDKLIITLRKEEKSLEEVFKMLTK